MGRTVLADDSIQTYVNNLFEAGQWHLGIIIGQLTIQKDYAVRLIRTPEPVEDEVSEEEEEELLEATKSKRQRRRSDHKPESLVDADEKWAATHAKQVTRMLPGGLDVIGIFAVAPPTMMQSSQNTLRKVMFAIHKSLSKGQMVTQDNQISDRILLQICSSTRKSIDVGDPKSTFRPADWKTQSSPENWIKLTSEVAVNIHIAIPVKIENQSFLKQLQKSEILDHSATETKRSKGKDKIQSSQQTYVVDFLEKTNVCDPVISDNYARVVMKGSIHGRAFVYSKATVGEATQAMKTDVIRSLIARCELLCEDIDVVGEDKKVRQLYDTPVRVFGKLPGSKLDFCDYMFQDEKISEVTDRILELLNVEVTEEQLDLTSERVATEEDWSQATTVKSGISDTETDKQTLKQGFNVNLTALVAGAVAVGMAGFSYMLLGDT
ncbi:hypothetical protein KUTeg_001137 [Tegillarca granosa]|uniref:Protein odr-4 homolog n=1 Tax=Tegillarca granosa TaxID=220873 RepID=A0ABQ9FVL6_TEGGR|nr:hypothetical protein KUTeg_001137 [Tegillarca granosa]